MFLVVAVAASLTFAVLHTTALSSLPSYTDHAWQSWLKLFLSPLFIGIVLFLALFCSVVAFLGMNKYQPQITAVQASIIYSSEPVFASSWALFLPGLLGVIETKIGYPNEIISAHLVLGGTLVLLANIVSLWPKGS